MLGDQGEALAAGHLEASGYTILARGYRTRRGEIDLIASRRGVLVFVEVKTRRGERFAAPAESVDRGKRLRLARAAAHYLAASGAAAASCRFDVIAVTCPEGGGVRVDHIEDAFRPEA